ncbi:MAG: hypothetical protein RQ966_12610 [Acetobacteraceae bacterium]|nr:hypothetical protein [Acetobacteraceae bacterium]
MALTLAAASLASGCVQPGYYMPGPNGLQPYPLLGGYRSGPDYRPPVAGPIPLQEAPVTRQPLPAEPPPAAATEPPADSAGPIPVQDMPPPAPATSTSPADATPAATAPTPTPEVVRKVPTSGPGSNVPLEGFRPMKGQTRPAP